MSNTHIHLFTLLSSAPLWAEARLCNRGVEQRTNIQPEVERPRSIRERTRSLINATRERIAGRVSAVRETISDRASKTRIESVRHNFRSRLEGILDPALEHGHKLVSSTFDHGRKVLRSISPLVDYKEAEGEGKALDVERQRFLQEPALSQYQKSIQRNPEQRETENSIFEYHPGTGPEPRRLVVLVMGNRQNFDSDSVAMRELQQRYAREQGVDVLLFRNGNAVSDLLAGVTPSSDYTRHTEVVARHIENIVYARLHCNGIFTGQKPPTEVSMAGYSFGGGTIEQLSQRWNRLRSPVPVGAVALIDPVRLGSIHSGRPLTERPAVAQRVLQLYQTENINRNRNERNGRTSVVPVHGAAITNLRPGDRSVVIRDTGHREIQDPRFHRHDVIDPVYNFLNSQAA